MLVGREVERARLDLLLTEALAGRSGGLVLRGEAGIGKSALCSYAAEQADEMMVLRARGVETESDLAFSGLAELLEPALGLLEEIPVPQAAALAGALAIGPPVQGDRFAICAATLSLLAAAAHESPLLAIVDDAHWLDRSSAEALLFASRRLSAEDIALVLAVRDGYPSLFGQSELPELKLSRLDHDAAGTLLRSRVDVQIAPEVAERVLVAAAGNPLALIEIPSVLSDAQLSGAEPISEALSASPTVEHAFLRRLEALPEESRAALLVAAASESGELESITRALLAFDLDPRALEAVETVGLTSVERGKLQFRHTLLRTTVYTTASAGERRAAHQALAEAAGAGQHTDGRAWHLAAAAPGHDEGAAAALEEAALGARRRGGHAEAASAFERAAELSADEGERARRLREAASDDWLVGRVDKAGRLLAEALSCAHDPIARARIQHLRAAVEMWHGSPAVAHELLAAEAEKIETLDPSRAARMLTDGAWACFMAAEIDSGLATARRACAVAARVGGDAETLPKGVLGIALVLGGDSQLAVPLFANYLRLLEEAELQESVSRAFRPDGLVLTWFEQYEQAREVLTRTIDGARARSALGALPYALATLSDVDFRTGRWVSAYAGASEAVRIAEETGQTASLAFSLACLARVEAAQGRDDACRAHAARALKIGQPQIGAVAAFVSSALGLLELGLGRSEQAIVHLESLAGRVAARGLREPAVIQWAPDLIEAYVRVGRRGDAEHMLEEFEHAARASERTWALAAAARCRLLLADDDCFEAEFRGASELHDGSPTPFERARTELCLGERLRRARRRSEAREPLVAALETFERLGAAPWAERARAELAASGQTAGRGSASTLEQLTPQELQVALVVARGATNKETGAALFLSPKTIETHLGRVYRKLGVRSRTELARLLASEGALVEAAA